jgi:hypothetical protein
MGADSVSCGKCAPCCEQCDPFSYPAVDRSFWTELWLPTIAQVHGTIARVDGRLAHLLRGLSSGSQPGRSQHNGLSSKVSTTAFRIPQLHLHARITGQPLTPEEQQGQLAPVASKLVSLLSGTMCWDVMLDQRGYSDIRVGNLAMRMLRWGWGWQVPRHENLLQVLLRRESCAGPYHLCGRQP